MARTDRRAAAADRHSIRLGQLLVQSPTPHYIEPLFTRDRQISGDQVLMAMMAIKGSCAYGVDRLNHGIGFDTAAIELLLPTYAKVAGPREKDLPPLGAQSASDADSCDRSGLWSIHSFGSARHGSYVRARPDVFTGDGSCAAIARSARRPATTPATCSSAHLLQIDWPATARPKRAGADRGLRRRAEHGGGRARAPARRRRGSRGRGAARPCRRATLVVQMVETFASTWSPRSSSVSMHGTSRVGECAAPDRDLRATSPLS